MHSYGVVGERQHGGSDEAPMWEWVDVNRAAQAVVEDAVAEYGRMCARQSTLKSALAASGYPSDDITTLVEVPTVPLLTATPPRTQPTVPHAPPSPAAAAARDFIVHGMFRGEPASAFGVAQYLVGLQTSATVQRVAVDGADGDQSVVAAWARDLAASAPLPECVAVLRNAPSAAAPAEGRDGSFVPSAAEGSSHQRHDAGGTGPGAPESLVSQRDTSRVRSDAGGGEREGQVEGQEAEQERGPTGVEAEDSLLLAGDDVVLGLRHSRAVRSSPTHFDAAGGVGEDGTVTESQVLHGASHASTHGGAPPRGTGAQIAARRTAAVAALAFDAEARWRELLEAALCLPSPLRFLLRGGPRVGRTGTHASSGAHDTPSAGSQSAPSSLVSKANLHRYVWAVVEAFVLAGSVNLGNVIPGYSSAVTFVAARDVAAAIAVEVGMREARVQELQREFAARGLSWLAAALPASEVEEFVCVHCTI